MEIILLPGQGEDCHRYRLNDGREIVLSVDDNALTIRVTASDGRLVGTLEVQEAAPGDFMLARMDLRNAGESYLRNGIGRLCLQFWQELTNASLMLQHPHALARKAPSFAAKMADEGLLDPIAQA